MDPEDDDLARAIALSLQEAQVAKPPVREFVDLDEDDDDEEAAYQEQLRQALEASKAVTSREPSQISDALPAQSAGPGPSTSVFLSERAQLEKERIERQKRLRKDVEVQKADEDDDDEEEDEEPSAKRQRLSSSSRVRANGQPSASTSASTSNNGPPTTNDPMDQLFWNGECRPTANQHAFPRADGKPTFRLREVLGHKNDISFAILSSYALDTSWIYNLFDPSVPVILVAQPDGSGDRSVRNILPNWIRTTPFLRGGFGCQHMKFMLIFYKNGRLRVVVTTANLYPPDWRDIENAVWLQDIPLRPKPIAHDPKSLEDFPAVMQRALHGVHVRLALETMLKQDHPNLPLQKIEDLRCKWDWSKVRAHLVPSLAGKHEGWPNVILTGHPRLMKVVRNMGLQIGGSKRLSLECQGSSIGQYTTQWTNEFYHSACGKSANDWLDKPKKSREKLPYPPIKIVFPTVKTVRESKLGEQGGGTIFCQQKAWAGAKFPRQLFFDSKSKGGPVLMHTKMILGVIADKPNEEDSATEDSDDDIEIIDPAVGWAYLGSHNFTPSAWGTLSGSAFNPILNIRNYELGVVFPLKTHQDVERAACWQRPPAKYGKEGPWIQENSVYFQQ